MIFILFLGKLKFRGGLDDIVSIEYSVLEFKSCCVGFFFFFYRGEEWFDESFVRVFDFLDSFLVFSFY